MNQRFETNGHHNVGVLNPTSTNTSYIDDFSKYVDLETGPAQDEEQEGRAWRKRGKVIGGFFVLAILALVVGLFFWMTMGGKKKIDLPVRDRNTQTDQVATRNTEDVTAQAIAEIRGTTTAPAPSASPVIAAGTPPVASTAPVTVALGGTITTIEPAKRANTNSGQSAAIPSTSIVPEHNPERSIRCAPVPKTVAAAAIQTTAPAPAAQTLPSKPSALPRNADNPVVLPSFGAMLPVRTLGAIYTLRPSLARLELTREVRGQGWLLKKGTVLIGRQLGSEHDRAYITLMGFIDPASGRLVKLSGDVLGADGAPGLRGKRPQINSRWDRVLGQAANAAVSLGQAALTNGSGVNVYLPGVVSPEIQSLSQSTISRREFVEISAGATAYVLITDLPREAQGIDPQPIAENQVNGGPALSEEELANLLSGGSKEQIRAALPRMTPELRQIAEMVLKESGR